MYSDSRNDPGPLSRTHCKYRMLVCRCLLNRWQLQRENMMLCSDNCEPLLVSAQCTWVHLETPSKVSTADRAWRRISLKIYFLISFLLSLVSSEETQVRQTWPQLRVFRLSQRALNKPFLGESKISSLQRAELLHWMWSRSSPPFVEVTVQAQPRKEDVTVIPGVNAKAHDQMSLSR